MLLLLPLLLSSFHSAQFDSHHFDFDNRRRNIIDRMNYFIEGGAFDFYFNFDAIVIKLKSHSLVKVEQFSIIFLHSLRFFHHFDSMWFGFNVASCELIDIVFLCLPIVRGTSGHSCCVTSNARLMGRSMDALCIFMFLPFIFECSTLHDTNYSYCICNIKSSIKIYYLRFIRFLKYSSNDNPCDSSCRFDIGSMFVMNILLFAPIALSSCLWRFKLHEQSALLNASPSIIVVWPSCWHKLWFFSSSSKKE